MRTRRSRARISAAVVVVFAIVAVFVVRLVDIQIVQAQEYNAESEDKRARTLITYGTRGDIVDTNGAVLADSVLRYDITASPRVALSREDAAASVLADLTRIAAITAQDPALIVRQGLSHVPEGREVFPLLSVRDNLAMGAYTRNDRDGVGRDLEAVFGYFPILRERAAQDAGLLSGGQQQMLAISRALMAAPDLILLDEPSLGLSPKLTKEIFEIVVRINRERGTTILLVEQNANMALNAADYGYVLENGRIVLEDTCARLREKDDIKEFYLGMKEAGVRGERRWKKKKNWR